MAGEDIHIIYYTIFYFFFFWMLEGFVDYM